MKILTLETDMTELDKNENQEGMVCLIGDEVQCNMYQDWHAIVKWSFTKFSFTTPFQLAE